MSILYQRGWHASNDFKDDICDADDDCDNYDEDERNEGQIMLEVLQGEEGVCVCVCVCVKN